MVVGELTFKDFNIFNNVIFVYAKPTVNMFQEQSDDMS